MSMYDRAVAHDEDKSNKYELKDDDKGLDERQWFKVGSGNQRLGAK